MFYLNTFQYFLAPSINRYMYYKLFMRSDMVGFIYPMYMSIKAIESVEKADDSQWLTYWLIFSLFKVVHISFFHSIDFSFFLISEHLRTTWNWCCIECVCKYFSPFFIMYRFNIIFNAFEWVELMTWHSYLLCVFSLDVQIVEGVADFILSTIPFYFIIKVERNLSKNGFIKVNVFYVFCK